MPDARELLLHESVAKHVLEMLAFLELTRHELLSVVFPKEVREELRHRDLQRLSLQQFLE